MRGSPKIQDAKKSPSGHHRTCRAISSELRHTGISTIWKKTCKAAICPPHVPAWPTSGWDRSGSLGHPCKFQRVLRLGSVTAPHCSSGRQPNFAALNRGRHLYSAGRPWRWALAHISSYMLFFFCHPISSVKALNVRMWQSSNPNVVASRQFFSHLKSDVFQDLFGFRFSFCFGKL